MSLISERCRHVTIEALDDFLSELQNLKKKEDYQGIVVLLPFIEDSLDAVRQSQNQDLSTVYAPLFQREVPLYRF